jgi:queuine tRNA-ribosyltransferase
MFKFTINHKDKTTKARTGVIATNHGKLTTPAFIPVATKATIKALTMQQFSQIGFESLLCNTYHLYLQPGSNTVAKVGKLHNFMGFNGPIWTDSGGFQVFSLNDANKITDEGVTFLSHIDDSKHFISPEISMQIQNDLGADIIFTFDECIHFDDDYNRTNNAMQRTHQWTKRCISELKKLNSNQALFGIVQGGKFKDLREESAKFISSLDFPGYGIGGIFGDPSKEIHEVVKHTMQFLPYEKPKHMLGIGSVEDIFDYVEYGADTFDCVLPTRLARMGYVFFKGNVKNKFRYRITKAIYKEDQESLEKGCLCYVCKNFTRAYIHHLYKAKEILFNTLMTYHNLFFFSKLMQDIREAIGKDQFIEMKKEWII